MSALDLSRHDLLSLAALIGKKEISPVELVQACLERIHSLNPRINAFLTLCEDSALEQAKQAQAEILKGAYRGPLHGIPYAAKDLICTKGIRTTCASQILADHVPDFDATVVEKLRKAGAVLIGKSHLHEFAFGLTNHNPHYGPARNPWDPDRITGGSSGGSAAAVASGCVPLGLGTDTGGSIRIPGSLCGLTGLKPSYGRVSKYGVFPLAWSLDHLGPLTRTAADAVAVLGVLAGHDPKDPSSIEEPVGDYPAALQGGLSGLVMGVPDTMYFEQIDPEVKSLVEAAAGRFRDLGAQVRPIHIPDLDKAATATLLILSSEAASSLGKYHREQGEKLGADVRSRLDAGATHLATHYLDAMRYRRRVQDHFSRAFKEVDLLLTPGVSIPATKIEDGTVNLDGVDIPVGIALTRCTRIYNLLGLPSAVTPCGLNSQGLPVALQLAGRPFAEATVLRAVHAYQQEGFSIKDWPLA
ncbi:MAG: amidase [Desulfarculaceae bacterium]|jgi:aspartyl-tRNA(Asn)/glutamyl-tRNA(Gln) amidotransferase subunit A